MTRACIFVFESKPAQRLGSSLKCWTSKEDSHFMDVLGFYSCFDWDAKVWLCCQASRRLASVQEIRNSSKRSASSLQSVADARSSLLLRTPRLGNASSCLSSFVLCCIVSHFHPSRRKLAKAYSLCPVAFAGEPSLSAFGPAHSSVQSSLRLVFPLLMREESVHLMATLLAMYRADMCQYCNHLETRSQCSEAS